MPHSKMIPSAVLASGLLMLLHGVGVARAESSIICQGNFQIVDGRSVATSFCRHRNLARVARSYGIRVSERKLRASESRKGDVCRAIGFDTRVEEICAPYLIGRSTVPRTKQGQ
jgi:hypothetical protein